MTDQTVDRPTLAVHGGKHLPLVEVDSYNLETRDDEGFLGDRITKAAFSDFIDDLRKLLRKRGEDPLGEQPTEDLRKNTLDKLLAAGEPEAAAVVQGAIEDFAHELAMVIRRFLKLKAWRQTERIAVGGGFQARDGGQAKDVTPSASIYLHFHVHQPALTELTFGTKDGGAATRGFFAGRVLVCGTPAERRANLVPRRRFFTAICLQCVRSLMARSDRSRFGCQRVGFRAKADTA